MADKNTISHTQAINIVGKALFAADWVGEMLFRDKEAIFPGISAEDKSLIEEFGPRPGPHGGITAKPCPTQAKLERALGRQHLIPAQRGAAADWLVDRGLARASGCDSDAIAAAIAHLSTNEATPRSAPAGLLARKDAVQVCIDRGMIPPSTTTWPAFCDHVRDLADGWIDKRKGKARRRFNDKTIERDVKKLLQ